MVWIWLPKYESLEIEGQVFSVAQSNDRGHDDELGDSVIDALLQLTPEEFLAVQNLLAQETMHIRRIGVDTTSHVVRQQAPPLWSQYEEHYKLAVLFVPADRPQMFGDSMVTKRDYSQLAKQVYAITARFEALLNYLAEHNLIDEEARRTILNNNWESLLSPARKDEIRWELNHMPDVETFINDSISDLSELIRK